MAEYIEREAAVRIAESYGLANGTSIGRHSGIADIIGSAIEFLPAADVAPVKHGTWIEVEGDKLVGIDSNGKDMYRYYRYNICAKCGKRNVIKSNFCPNCGAKMDLEEGK